MNKLYDVLDIALYVIQKSYENNYSISNLKLQKILYYVQANFLVKKNLKCFDEEILRWNYGPVVRSIYDEFKCYGYGNIPENINCKTFKYDKVKNKIIQEIKNYLNSAKDIMGRDKILIDQVVLSYATLDAFELVNKTHQEEPWLSTLPDQPIDVNLIKEYYRNNPERLLGQNE